MKNKVYESHGPFEDFFIVIRSIIRYVRITSLTIEWHYASYQPKQSVTICACAHWCSWCESLANLCNHSAKLVLSAVLAMSQEEDVFQRRKKQRFFSLLHDATLLSSWVAARKSRGFRFVVLFSSSVPSAIDFWESCENTGQTRARTCTTFTPSKIGEERTFNFRRNSILREPREERRPLISAIAFTGLGLYSNLQQNSSKTQPLKEFENVIEFSFATAIEKAVDLSRVCHQCDPWKCVSFLRMTFPFRRLNQTCASNRMEEKHQHLKLKSSVENCIVERENGKPNSLLISFLSPQNNLVKP